VLSFFVFSVAFVMLFLIIVMCLDVVCILPPDVVCIYVSTVCLSSMLSGLFINVSQMCYINNSFAQ